MLLQEMKDRSTDRHRRAEKTNTARQPPSQQENAGSFNKQQDEN